MLVEHKESKEPKKHEKKELQSYKMSELLAGEPMLGGEHDVPFTDILIH